MKIKKMVALFLAMLLLCVPMMMVASAAGYTKDPGKNTPEYLEEHRQEIIEHYSPEVYDKIVSGEYYFGEDGELYDLFGNKIPMSAAAPSTGIDQNELSLQRAFNVVIFALGISLASVGAVVAVKKFGASK